MFVLLVCFLRHGIIGGIGDLFALARRGKAQGRSRAGAGRRAPVAGGGAASRRWRRGTRVAADYQGPILQATGLTKRYGGVVANSDIDFTVQHGELRGIIGPNGAGKTTFFKMLTCEVPPTSGAIVFEGRDITGMSVTDVCQLGLTKSYQVNQLFNRLTVRENLTIAALAELRGKFRLDLFAQLSKHPGPRRAGRAHAAARQPHRARRHAGVAAGLRREAAAGDRPRARVLARACCCSTSRSPA